MAEHYVLMPVVATEEMEEAGNPPHIGEDGFLPDGELQERYQAMVKARPEVPEAVVEKAAIALAERYTPGVWSKRSGDPRWQDWREVYMKDGRAVMAALAGGK